MRQAAPVSMLSTAMLRALSAFLNTAGAISKVAPLPISRISMRGSAANTASSVSIAAVAMSVAAHGTTCSGQTMTGPG